MATARKPAEPPEAREDPWEPGGDAKSTDKAELKALILEVLGELDDPGEPEIEAEPEKPEGPQTFRQIEEAAERIVRRAQEMLSPPPKEKAEDTPEPERAPEPHTTWREKLWR